MVLYRLAMAEALEASCHRVGHLVRLTCQPGQTERSTCCPQSSLVGWDVYRAGLDSPQPGLRVRLPVEVEKVAHGGRLCRLVECIEDLHGYLLRGPEGVGSDGALSLP